MRPTGPIAAALAAVLATTATAQTPSEPRAQQPRGRLLDAVIAYVGDKAILRSSVWSEVQARINAVSYTPTPEQILDWQLEFVRARHREEALAQGARAMRGTTAKQVDDIFEQVMKDHQQREIERAGSVNKLRDELGVLGKTWGHVREEQRTETLAQLAQQQAWATRYRDRWALMVTPRRMQDYYNANIDLFVQEGSADLEVVSFLVRPRTPERRAELHELARHLATAWRDSGADAEEIAARFDATATVLSGVRNTEADQTRAEFKTFAEKAAAGTISEPMDIAGRLVSVVRVVRRNEAQNRSFDDPAVQAEIHAALANLEQAKIRARLYRKSLQLFPLNEPGHLIEPGEFRVKKR